MVYSLSDEIEREKEKIDIILEGEKGLYKIKEDARIYGLLEPGLIISPGDPKMKENRIYILNKKKGRSGSVGEFFKAVRVNSDYGDVDEFVRFLLKTTAIEHLYYNSQRYLDDTEKTSDNRVDYERTETRRNILEEMFKEKLPIYNQDNIDSIKRKYGFKSELELLGVKYMSRKRVGESENIDYSDIEREFILRKLKNESIPDFRGAFKIDDGGAAGSYLCIEYIDGDNLLSIMNDSERLKLQEYNIPVNVAFTIGCRFLRAVEEISKPRMIMGKRIGYSHGDIDPSNILITDNGNTFLIDYSIIQEFDYDNLPSNSIGYKSAGKPSYMSPMALEGLIHPMNDIHSAGVVMYEMITGRRPFRHPSGNIEYVKKMIKKKKKPSSMRKLIGKEVQKEADEIVISCMNGNYTNVLDLQHSLSDFLYKKGITGDYEEYIKENLMYYREKDTIRSTQYKNLDKLTQ